jgi:hypothetical protein
VEFHYQRQFLPHDLVSLDESKLAFATAIAETLGLIGFSPIQII